MDGFVRFPQGASSGRRGRPDGQRGSTTVELALVLPVFLLFVMGIIELGNLFRVMLTMHKAAEFGARAAITGAGVENGTRLPLIVQETNRMLEGLPGEPPVITVSSWPGVRPTGAGREGDAGQPCEMVEVKVDYEYRFVTPLSLLGTYFGGEGMSTKVPLSQSDKKINEPWTPCG